MGREKEALRAPSKVGPRAALTRWGRARVPEGGKKHEQGEGSVFSLLREPMRGGATWCWLTGGKEHTTETSGKLVQKCP